ncbi:hypothetical protein OG264_04280 [Streptomyces xanthophaeus]|uniref:hypothetical protein n=1 Tax=Streptomyces xanthophaeus TaxID=67385 RepID=UPI00386B92F2|nr:hypothetical protein OG264_04280 [Streptomyces xanthophaeus]WST64230.1 hypothetical protein OG605_34080 [Streptomyces xanthophaeus]
MTDRPRSIVWLLMAGGGLAVAALASFLVDLTPDRNPPLTVLDVEGVWTTPSGGRPTVRADGSAEVERVPQAQNNCVGAPSSPSYVCTGPATWAFDTYPDEEPGIRFDYAGTDAGTVCTFHLSVSGSSSGRGFLPHHASPGYVREASPTPTSPTE